MEFAESVPFVPDHMSSISISSTCDTPFNPIDMAHYRTEQVRFLKAECIKEGLKNCRGLDQMDIFQVIRGGTFRQAFRNYYSSNFPEKVRSA